MWFLPSYSGLKTVGCIELDWGGELRPERVGFLLLPTVIKSLYLIYLMTMIVTI